MYGMGVPAIAEKIHSTKEEAQDIVDGFFKEFPNVKKWIDKTEENAKKTGYVEDWYGRKRRLPDLLLPKYTIKFKSENEDDDFNPFLICSNREIDEKTFDKYSKKLSKAKYYKEINNIKSEAEREGIEITSNNAAIAGATRQCVNARIQGGAATMTKIAMIQIYNDKELNDLGFKLLIGVHDELIGECPKENQDKVADRLTYIMKTCIADNCVVPFKCDADICDHWYYTSYAAAINKEYSKLLKDGLTNNEAFDKILLDHSESTKDFLQEIINEG